MEVKEAIDIVRLNTKASYEQIDELISLLQQSDKYKQMWEELYFNKIKWNDYSITVYMQELIKKYFSEGGEPR